MTINQFNYQRSGDLSHWAKSKELISQLLLRSDFRPLMTRAFGGLNLRQYKKQKLPEKKSLETKEPLQGYFK